MDISPVSKTVGIIRLVSDQFTYEAGTIDRDRQLVNEVDLISYHARVGCEIVMDIQINDIFYLC